MDIGCVSDGTSDLSGVGANEQGDQFSVNFDNNSLDATGVDRAFDSQITIVLDEKFNFGTTNAPNVIASGTSNVTSVACISPISVSSSLTSSGTNTLTLTLDSDEYDLDPGCDLTVNFELIAASTMTVGVESITSTLSYKNDDANIGFDNSSAEANSIQINQGQAVVSITPDSSLGAVKDTIIWTAVVENTGTGGLCKVDFGLVSSAVTITDVFYNAASQGAITSGDFTDYLKAGDNFTATVTGDIAGCIDISNKISVTDKTSLYGGNADSSIVLDLETPLIDYTIPSLADFVFDGVRAVSFTVDNTGRGDAVDVKIGLTLSGNLAVEDTSISGGWIYDGTNFIYSDNSGVLVDGTSSTLAFNIVSQNVCPASGAGSMGGGTLIFIADYDDSCSNSYTLPVDLATIGNITGYPSISISKTNDTGDQRIDVGGSGEYSIGVIVNGSLGSGDITITDTLPSEIISTGSLTSSVGTTISCNDSPCSAGDVVSWVISGPPSGSYSATIPFGITTEQCDAGSTIVNTVGLSGSINYTINNSYPGSSSALCTISGIGASDSITITNNADDASASVDVNFNVGGSASGTFEAGKADDGDGIREDEEGEFIDFTASYEFGSGYDGTWSSANYSDNYGSRSNQTLIANTLTISADNGSTSVTNQAVPSGSINASAGSLDFDLDFLLASNGGPISDLTMADYDISIAYKATVPRTDIGSATHISTLSIDSPSDPGNACSVGGGFEYRQAAFVDVQNATAGISINIPIIIGVCQPIDADITISNGNAFNSSNILATLINVNASTNYGLNPAGTFSYGGDFSGNMTDAVIATNNHSFTHNTTPVELTQSSTITAPILLLPGYASSIISVNMLYDDEEAKLSALRIFSGSANDSPVIVNSADLAVTVSPETYVMIDDNLIYTVYVTNTGPSIAYGATLTNVVANGFEMDETATNNANSASANVGNIRPVGNVIYNSGTNKANWNLGDLDPGKTVQVEIEAIIDAGRGCSTITSSQINAKWGCSGIDVEKAPNNNIPNLSFPSGNLLVQYDASASECDLCDNGFVTLFASNTGSAALYDAEISADLRSSTSGVTFLGSPDLEFCVGSASAAGCAWISAPSDPTFNASGTTTINRSHISQLTELVSQDNENFGNSKYSGIFIRFKITAGEDAVVNEDNTIEANASAKTSCEQTVNANTSTYEYVVNKPALTIAKTGRNNTTDAGGSFVETVHGSNGDEVEWKIVITNNGSDVAQFVRLEDLLPGSGATINSVTGPGVVTTPAGSFIISVSNINQSSSATYNVNTTLGSTCVNANNTSQVTYGCSSNGVTTASNLLSPGHSDYSDSRDTAALVMTFDSSTQTSMSQSFTNLEGGRVQVVLSGTYNGGNSDISELTYQFPNAAYIVESSTATFEVNSNGTDSVSVTNPSGNIYDFDLSSLTNNTVSLVNGDTIEVIFIATTTGFEDTTSADLTNPETTANTFDPALPTGGNATFTIELQNSCSNTTNFTDTTTFDPATPDIDISVNPENSVVQNGSSYAFTFTLDNNGDASSIASNPTFDLAAGAGWTVDSLQIGGSNCTSTAQCNSSDIGNITSSTVAVVANVTVANTTSPLSLKGTIIGAITNGTENYSLDTATTRIVGFDVSKVLTSTTEATTIDGDSEVTIGEQITYTLAGQWYGMGTGESIENITITDSIRVGNGTQADLGFISVDSSASTVVISGTTTPAVNSSGNIVFTISDIIDTDIGSANSFNATIVTQVLNTSNSITNSSAAKFVRNDMDTQFDFNSETFNRTSYSDLRQRVDLDVVHPEISITKEVANIDAGSPAFGSVAGGDASDTYRYKVTINNDGDSPMFDIEVADLMDQNILNILTTAGTLGADTSGSGNDLSATNGAINDQGGTVTNGSPDSISFDQSNLTIASSNPEISLAQLDPGETITLYYEASAGIGASPGQMLGNDVTVKGSSVDNSSNGSASDTDSTNNSELTLEASDSADVTVDSVLFSKTITNTSASASGNNGNELLLIGEQVEFTISTTLPEGTITDYLIRDTLPTNMIYVANSAVVNIGSSISHSLASQEPVSTLNTQLDWDFGSTTTSGVNRDVTITYVAQVRNDSTNFEGETFVNSAGFSLDGTAPSSFLSSGTMEIDEPVITITKTANSAAATTINAGDVLTYTINISNAAGAAPAYNLNIVDTLNSGLSMVQTTSPTYTGNSDVNLGNDPDFTASTLILGLSQSSPQNIDLQAGETIEFTYEVLASDAVEPNQAIANNVTATWQSLNDGTTLSGTLGAAASSSGLRDGSNTSSLPNNNHGTDNSSITISNNYSITKAATSTPTVNTGASYRIGDIVEYTLNINIQEGTTDNVVIGDTLPSGLEFSSTTSTVPVSGSDGFTYIISSQPSADETALAWNFGTIVNQGEEVDANTNDTITIIYEAVVTDDATFPTPNALGFGSTDRINDAQIDYNDSADAANTAEVTAEPTINVSQPYLTISKAVLGGSTEFSAGQTVDYAISITNNGTAPAYGISADDDLPEGINDTAVTLVSALVDGSTNVSSDLTFVNNSGTPRVLEFDFPDTFALDPSEVLVLTYRATLDSNVLADQTINNSATIKEYLSYPDNSNIDQRTYTGASTGLSPAIAAITTPGADDLLKAINVGTANIGEIVTYSFTLPQSAVNAALSNVDFADTLPAGMVFDNSSFAVTSGHSVTSGFTTTNNTNDTLSVDLASLPAGQQLTFNVQATILNIPANDTADSFANSATFNYDERTGADITSNSVNVAVTEPNLAITKVFKSQSPAGDIEKDTDLTYTITVTNSGDGIAHGVQITDDAYEWLQSPAISNSPAGLGSVTAGAAVSSIIPYSISYANPIAASGGSISFDITFTVSDATSNPVIAFASISNQATVDYNSTSDHATNAQNRDNGDGYTDDSLVVNRTTGGVSLSKELANASVTGYSVGDEIGYIITFDGIKGQYTNLRIADILPIGMEYTGNSSFTSINLRQIGGSAIAILSEPSTGDIATLSFGFGNLEYVNLDAAGTKPQIKLTVAVRPQDSGNGRGTTLQNSASTLSDTPNFTVNSSSVDITIVEPELSLNFASSDASDPTNMAPGAPNTFEITVDHTGVSDAIAYQPKLQIQLPSIAGEGMDDNSPLSLSNAPVLTIQGGVRGNIVLVSGTDYVANYDGGTGILTFTLVSALAYMDIDEELVINFDAQLDNDVANGDTIVNPYATVTNYYSDNSSDGSGGISVPNEVRNYITALSDTIADGETDDHAIGVQAPTIGVVKSNNVSGNATPGDTVTYSVVVTNSGSVAGDDLVLTDELPQHFVPSTLAISSITSSALGDISGNVTIVINATGGANSNGSFNISTIDIAVSEVITIIYTADLEDSIPNGSTLTNTATLSQTGYSDITDGSDVDVASATNLTITKTSAEIADTDAAINTGDIIEYSISVSNDGNENLVNALLTDAVPGGTTYVANSMTVNSATTTDAVSGVLPLSSGYVVQTVGDSAGELNVGSAAIIITFRVKVDNGISDGTTISNKAYVQANPASTISSDLKQADDEVTNVIGDSGAIRATKTVSDETSNGFLAPTDILKYTIVIENYGVSALTNVILTDSIPTNTTYVSGKITYDSASLTDVSDADKAEFDGNNVIVNIGTLNVSSTVTITFEVEVDSGVADGTIISNQGTITSNELTDVLTDQDGNDANGKQPTDIVVGNNQPKIKVGKNVTDVNGANVEVGDGLEYTLTIQNIGSGDAANVNISDAGANEVTFVSSSLTIDGVANAAIVPFVNLNLGSIVAGGKIDVVYRVTINSAIADGTVIKNQASFHFDGSDCTGSGGAANCLSDADGDDGNETGNESGDTGDDDPTMIGLGNAAGTSSIAGMVWKDRNHDRQIDIGEPVFAGWIVILYNSSENEIARTTSASDGSYEITGIQPGSGYKIGFFSPDTGTQWGRPVSGDNKGFNNNADTDGIPEGTVNGAFIENLTLIAGITSINQSLPIDPRGVVYNSITRDPVSDALVSIYDNVGSKLGTNCVSSSQQDQTTGSNGEYAFDIFGSCPNLGSTFTVGVVPPVAGFLSTFPSQIISQQGSSYTPGTNGFSDSIDVIFNGSNGSNDTAPTASEIAGYHLSFIISSGSDDIVDNHIPIDPATSDLLTISKVTPKKEASRGDLIPYVITIKNASGSPLLDMNIVDVMPAGLKYIEGSSTIDGAKVVPIKSNRMLTWEDIDFAIGQEVKIVLLLIVGSGVSEGEYTNIAYVRDSANSFTISNIAQATVMIIPDPTFDCADLIGKVFDDSNHDGYQDQNEEGIAGVRLANTYGLLITTDRFGRYHVPCASIPNEMRGSNYILKLDTRTIPTGYVVTTENPRVVRLTRGKLSKLNFGAVLAKIIRINVTDHLFESENSSKKKAEMVVQLTEDLKNSYSNLRFVYSSSKTDKRTMSRRLDSVVKEVKENWKVQKWNDKDWQVSDKYDLIIATETVSTKSSDSKKIFSKKIKMILRYILISPFEDLFGSSKDENLSLENKDVVGAAQ
jgi:uncharacterized repeat protein (TIGR01451 family)/fimbrial isopeptide formation D2 family protein